jgi:hypothetical protein
MGWGIASFKDKKDIEDFGRASDITAAPGGSNDR